MSDLKNKSVEIHMKDGSILKGKLTANSTNDSLWVKMRGSGWSGGSVLAIKPSEVVKTIYHPYEEAGIACMVIGGALCLVAILSVPPESYTSYNGVRDYNDEERYDAAQKAQPIVISGVVMFLGGGIMYLIREELVNLRYQAESSK